TRSEQGLAPEGVDVLHDAPERILHDFFGILLVAGDPHRQAIHAAAVSLEEPLGGGRFAPTQRFDERPVTVHFRGGEFSNIPSWEVDLDARLEIRQYCARPSRAHLLTRLASTSCEALQKDPAALAQWTPRDIALAPVTPAG